ncbi:hypothetical protein N5S71_06170 [Aliarcobacter cryaerophilus]|uniref:phosphorylase family protein n=1 Tax=Aliarcobacter cryaerophilus TaxID=28198 RepID=UPI0021B69068|nr:hypothetical protein [Aliarcobacter cryaerophilus]MCT7462098.1 hypothetical protein [Aliarcobacter cryaerophilus]
MIKILLVDDDYTKIQNIISTLKENTGINEENIDTVNSAKEGKICLNKKIYDLLILDMNIPRIKGEEPVKDGGLGLLEQIHTKQIQNYPHHIIGITGFKDIFHGTKQQLEKYLWTLIYYDNSISDWKNQLINKVEYLIKGKKNLYGNCFKKFDFAVITALDDPEFTSVLSLPFNWKPFTIDNDPSINYFEGTIKDNDREYSIVAACSPKMGMVASSTLTTKMCFHFHPKYFFMVGIAAGMKDKNNIGDILIAEYSWDWGSGKHTTEFAPDHTQISLDPNIIAKLKMIKSNQINLDEIKNSYKGNKPSESLQMYIGPIASGASVLENQSTIDEMIKKYQRKLIGVEMEIYGVMSAIRYSITPIPIGICMKSVCDFGDSNKNDEWQKYAAYTSSKLMEKLIYNLLN